MNQNPRLSEWGRALLLLPLLGLAVISPASAQVRVPGPQKFVAGEIILYMQPGTPLVDANAVAAKVSPASVTPLMLKDCYVLQLPANLRTDQSTSAAVAQLKQDPRVRWVGASPIRYVKAPTLVPNDPRYKSGEQWAIDQMNMTKAWVLQKGKANVNVCVIDSGFAPAHEDNRNAYAVGSTDIADNDADFTADGTGGSYDHGAGVAGCISAGTNNNIGIAGTVWAGTKVVALKIQKKGTANLDFPSILNAYAYVSANKDKYHIVAINMSYGGPGDPTDTSNPEYVALKAIADAGILEIGATGNGGGSNLQDIPTALPFVHGVTATDRNKKVTSYSDTGIVTVAAPGGDSLNTGVPANGILLIGADTTSTYRFEDGTSFASPYAAGVVGLLMSFPNMTPARALKALQDGADKTGLGSLPDSKYGYGVVDAYNSFLKVSASASVNEPDGINPTNPGAGGNGSLQPAPVETLKPVMSFSVTNVPPSSVTFTLDKGGQTEKVFTLTQLQAGNVANVTDFAITGDTTSSTPDYTVKFRYTFPNSVPFSHTIEIDAVNQTAGITATDIRSFNIVSHIIPFDSSGVTFVSIPFFENQADKDAATQNGRGAALDSSVTLYRWLNSLQQNVKTGQTVLLGSYSVFGGGVNDINASLTPAAYVPTIDGAPSNSAPPSPLGVAYFLKASGPIPYVTYGQPITDSAFRVPLHEGWNMIGDPFPFSVGFNSILVEKPSGERLTIQTAVDKKMLLPHIYHYASGEYTFQTLPDGTLNAWQGQWIYVMPRNGSTTLKDGLALTLIVPPAGVSGSRAAAGPRLASTRASSGTTITVPRVVGSGSWAIRLQASTRNLKDSYNYIGMSSRATFGDDATKVPKPPKPTPYLSLGMTREDSSLGLLSQDLVPIGGAHTWNVSVTTDQPNTDVTLSWPDINTLPRNYRLTLKDTVTGQSVDLRNTSSYQFNSGHNAATRSFNLTATPAGHNGAVLLTNIFVNPSRATGTRAVTTYEIGYTVSQDVRVEASVLSFNGHVVSNLGPTRAATSGNNKIVWNGLDNSGHTIPAGSYLLQLRALTTDGQVTRQVVPLVITGR